MALNELSNNQDIISHAADKESAVVVLSKDKYIKEARCHLNTKDNERHYNPFQDIEKRFDTLLKKTLHEGCINENEFGFLSVEHPVMATFYLLPKVHKGPKNNPPGHHIISGKDTLTEPTFKYID